MRVPDFTVEHLKKLPLRAIVAFAARCARRVERLAQLPQGQPLAESRRMAVEAALRMAELYARGSDEPPDGSVLAAIAATRGATNGPEWNEAATAAAADAANAAANAAAIAGRLTSRREAVEGGLVEAMTADARRCLGSLATVTADLAALGAFTAAVEAFASVGYHNEDFVAVAWNDYDTLVRLGLGRYPEAGAPVDPSPDGPLGPL